MGESGKLLDANEFGGLIADERFGEEEPAASLDGEFTVPVPFIWVRTELLSSFVPFAAGSGGGVVGGWFSLLDVSTLPMWVVRTVFSGEPLLLLLVVVGMLLRLLLEPREARLWLSVDRAALEAPAAIPLWFECLMDESCV